MRSTRVTIAHGRRRRIAAAITGVAVATAIATPAFAAVSEVSAARDRDGFPVWYGDANGVKVVRCVADAKCLDGVQTGPVDESFYAVARAEVALKSDRPNVSGGRARYRAVLEAAWATEEMNPGDQITFWRTQVTADKVDLQTYPSGTEIVFATPYGNLKGKVTGDIRKGRFTGKLDRARLESALGIPELGFKGPLGADNSRFGSTFLMWDDNPGAADRRPAGFLGNPLVLHTIKGATTGNPNAFYARSSTSQPGAASAVETQFEVAGQCLSGC